MLLLTKSSTSLALFISLFSVSTFTASAAKLDHGLPHETADARLRVQLYNGVTGPGRINMGVAGMSPKITTAPQPPRWLRNSKDMEYWNAKRDDGGQIVGFTAPDNTCGYVSGVVGAYKSCATDQKCFVIPEQPGTLTPAMACCGSADEDSCTYFGHCINSFEYEKSCDQACRQDQNTVKCTEAKYPYCYAYTMPSPTALLFLCDSVTWKTEAELLRTVNGDTDARVWSPVYQSDLTATVDVQSIHSAAQVTVSINTNGDSEGTNRSGAIAGGVVGGIAVLFIGAGLLWYLWQRQERQRAESGKGAYAPASTGAGVPLAQQQHQYDYSNPPGFMPQGSLGAPVQPYDPLGNNHPPPGSMPYDAAAAAAYDKRASFAPSEVEGSKPEPEYAPAPEIPDAPQEMASDTSARRLSSEKNS